MEQPKPIGFDPMRVMSKLGGKDYLEVKWRLVWLRDRYPRSVIRTAVVELTDQRAVFSAEIMAVDEDGVNMGVGSGHGSETPKDFGDFIEKAETKAIGRALAALGFGTQFAPDLDEGTRIVDSPVQRPQRPATQRPASNPTPTPINAQQAPQRVTAPSEPPRNDPNAITPKQIDMIASMLKACHLTEEDAHAEVRARFGVNRYDGLTRKQGSEYITTLMERRDEIEAERARDAHEATVAAQPAMPGTESPAEEFERRLREAPDLDALNRVAKEIAAVGAGTEQTRAIYRERLTAFAATR